ncbi:MAG: hypothetical protein ABSH28_08390 [Acidobacteriota bacterium]|jgi:hypothetical protein
MIKRKIYAVVFATLLVPFLHAVPAQAHGDKVVPQMVDGLSSDGTRLRTIFDFTSLTLTLSTSLTKVTLLFFNEDGSPWQVTIKSSDPSVTSPLTTSSYPLNLSPAQAIRIETLGTGDQRQGYAILRNLEATTDLPDDNQVSITVYYEIAKSNGLGGFDIFETVSVPVGQPTVSWAFPVEIDNSISPALRTAFAIVNLSDMPDISSNLYVSNTTNTVTLDLFGTDGTFQQEKTFQLNSQGSPRKVAQYVDQSPLFSGLPATFRGTVFASSTGPVAFLSLQETPTTTTTSTGVKFGQQYASLVPTYLDSLRTNTFMLLPQGYSLDGDIPVVDYFNDENSSVDAYYETPWDLLYRTGSTTTERSLVPYAGTISSIGVLTTWDEFNALMVEDLSKLNYTTDPIDLGDTSANLTPGFCFAIKTGLGRYAKVMIWNLVGYSNSYYIDMMLAIQVFK